MGRVNLDTTQLGNRDLCFFVGSSTIKYGTFLPLLVKRVSLEDSGFFMKLN